MGQAFNAKAEQIWRQSKINYYQLRFCAWGFWDELPFLSNSGIAERSLIEAKMFLRFAS